jgi:hypothetical protein
MPAYSCGDLTPGPHPWDNECPRLRSATGKKQVAGTLLHGCPVAKSVLRHLKADPQKSRLNRARIGGEPTPIQVEMSRSARSRSRLMHATTAGIRLGLGTNPAGLAFECLGWLRDPYIV